MDRLRKIGQLESRPALAIGPSRLGLGFEKLDRNAFDPETAYDLVAETGVHYIRLQSGWQRTEKEKGVYDFAWLDRIVDELICRGLEPWIDLCYGNGLYTPDAQKYFGAVGCPPIFSPEEKAAWRSYVEALVHHYDGKVSWFEIWNEPDGRGCWKHGIDAGEYGDFAVDTCKAIHRANPRAHAIAGVTCSIHLSFFQTMFDHGVASVCDAVSFHRYRADELDALRDIHALRALIDRYNPKVGIIQGESGTQSDSRGAGALQGGSWTERKQAKYLLRQRLIDLSSEVLFTSHFSALDMVEALNGIVGDKQSYLDYGYFGVLHADFDQNGVASGRYSPKLSYRALQHLAVLFTGDVTPCDLPMRRIVLDSPRVFDRDEAGSRLVTLGFQGKQGTALAYWKAADLMRETFEGTVSFEVSLMREPPVLCDLMTGDYYALPESMIEKNGGNIVRLVHLPLTDSPLLLMMDGFAALGGQMA